MWVDGLASGYYQKPPDKPVFVSFDSSHETLLALRDMYPEWTFFGREIHGEYRGNSLRDISELQEGQQVHHIYLGNHLSFIDENSRSNLLDFINEHLAPGGYVVAGYESATGWSTYKVVIDVLRELVQGSNQVVDVDMLDKLFFELNKLAENKIMAFQGQAQLDKLLQHLKQMPSYHRDLLLRSEQFYTFYPSDVHRLLSGQGSQSLRACLHS